MGGCECEVVEVRMVECRYVGGCEWVVECSHECRVMGRSPGRV